MKWKTQTGKVLDIKNMEINHIKNCIAMLERKNTHEIFQIDEDNFGCANFDDEIEVFNKELKRRSKIK